MIKPIRNKSQYDSALERIYELMQLDIVEHSSEFDELEILSVLVENYEKETFPIDLPDPIEAIKFRMEQLGLEKKDMVKFFGYKSRVSEVFSGKRKLNLNMIRKIHKELGIPASSLLG